jgi:hypothetical protein
MEPKGCWFFMEANLVLVLMDTSDAFTDESGTLMYYLACLKTDSNHCLNVFGFDCSI